MAQVEMTSIRQGMSTQGPNGRSNSRRCWTVTMLSPIQAIENMKIRSNVSYHSMDCSHRLGRRFLQRRRGAGNVIVTEP